MTQTLIRDARLLGHEGSWALAIDAGAILWVGADERASAYSGAHEVIDAQGDLVAPAFVDAHVHLVQTGMALGQLDLTSARSWADLLALVAQHPGQDSSPVIAWGWDDARWPDADLIDAGALAIATRGREAYLARVDGHSALVTPGLLQVARGAEGYRPSGRIERDAHHLVRARLDAETTNDHRRRAVRAGCEELAGRGVVGFHENAAPHIGSVEEIAIIREVAGEVGLRPTIYWGETGAYALAREHGLPGLAGDLNADGALGSRTAALRTDYRDAPGERGHAYLSETEIADHVTECTRRGLQAGFHCIGDLALDTVAAGLSLAAQRCGLEAIRAARHRLEHVEMPSDSVIAVLARLGVHASVQPAFDAAWGGPTQMYADRVGERWRAMNPLRAMVEAGVSLAFGSDSPVTPIDPWGGVAAAMHHRNTDQRLDFQAAFAAHTLGGWRAGKDDASGRIAAGQRADLARWEVSAYAEDGNPDLTEHHPRLRQCWSAGRTIWKEPA